MYEHSQTLSLDVEKRKEKALFMDIAILGEVEVHETVNQAVKREAKSEVKRLWQSKTIHAIVK